MKLSAPINLWAIIGDNGAITRAPSPDRTFRSLNIFTAKEAAVTVDLIAKEVAKMGRNVAPKTTIRKVQVRIVLED